MRIIHLRGDINMSRLVLVIAIAFLLSGCGIDNSFERGYIISNSEAGVQVPADSVDE